MIVAVPFATAVTSPVVALTVATAGLLEEYVTLLSVASAGDTVSVKSYEAPTVKSRLALSSATPVTETVDGADEPPNSSDAGDIVDSFTDSSAN